MGWYWHYPVSGTVGIVSPALSHGKKEKFILWVFVTDVPHGHIRTPTWIFCNTLRFSYLHSASPPTSNIHTWNPLLVFREKQNNCYYTHFTKPKTETEEMETDMSLSTRLSRCWFISVPHMVHPTAQSLDLGSSQPSGWIMSCWAAFPLKWQQTFLSLTRYNKIIHQL